MQWWVQIYIYFFYILENVGYWEKTKWKNEWIYFFLCIHESVPRNEEEEEIKHENQQQKQQSEPIFTISTLRRCSVCITHSREWEREREKMYSLFKIIIRMRGLWKNQYHHHDLSLNDVVIVNDVVCKKRRFSHIKIIKSILLSEFYAPSYHIAVKWKCERTTKIHFVIFIPRFRAHTPHSIKKTAKTNFHVWFLCFFFSMFPHIASHI